MSKTPTEDECDSVLVSEMAGTKGRIHLVSEGIAFLKSGDFDGLTQVSEIDLAGNGLMELPVGIFSGLSELLVLLLEGNPGADFELQVHLQVTLFGTAESFAAGSLRLVMPVGAPRTVTIPVTLTGGTPTTGSLTVPTGGVESSALRFTRGKGDFQVRTGSITLNQSVFGTSYSGFEIVEGDRSTITAATTRIRARIFLEGALE